MLLQHNASDRTHRYMRHVPQELSFHRVNSISMTFGVTMNEGSMGITYAWEMFSLARSLLRTLLESRSPPSGLHSLSIEKLPCCLLMTDLSQCLLNIRKLEIDITILTATWDPQHIQTSSAAMGFYARVPEVFLAPASNNLRVLHLSADCPWGWYPKIDLRSIRFPYLESLTLSRFIFSHDWQMNWLSNHADTLKRLSLINCAILRNATSPTGYLDGEGYPRRIEFDDLHLGTTTRSSWHHEKLWSEYFLRFAHLLSSLQSFSLVAPDPVIRNTRRQGIPHEENQACCNPKRYMSIADTPGPPDVPGYEYSQATQDEDQWALWVLLFVIRRRNLGQMIIPFVRHPVYIFWCLNHRQNRSLEGVK